MKIVDVLNPQELEEKLEKYTKQAYASEEYLRCNNLVKHLLKVNPKNKVWLYYKSKLTPSLLKKARYKWVWWKGFRHLLFDVKTYILLLIIFVIWRR